MLSSTDFLENVCGVALREESPGPTPNRTAIEAKENADTAAKNLCDDYDTHFCARLGTFSQEVEAERKCGDDLAGCSDVWCAAVDYVALPRLEQAVVMNLNCTYDRQTTLDAVIPGWTGFDWDESDWKTVLSCVNGPQASMVVQDSWLDHPPTRMSKYPANDDLYREFFDFTANSGTLIVNLTFSSETQVEPIHRICLCLE